MQQQHFMRKEDISLLCLTEFIGQLSILALCRVIEAFAHHVFEEGNHIMSLAHTSADIFLISCRQGPKCVWTHCLLSPRKQKLKVE